MEEVKVVDKFLSVGKLEEVYKYTSNIEWVVQRSDNSSNISFLMHNVIDEYYTKKLFKKVKKQLDIDVKLERVYFNGQNCGREGKIHKDGCDLTALIYISEYKIGWGGFTQVSHPDGRQDIIEPVQGRLVLFNGNHPHKGFSYAYQECPMRINLAYKMNFK
tara:strand:+ start:4890 stop:5372 length:483 start_codon:yes stop_codon:yes gene_type:complete